MKIFVSLFVVFIFIIGCKKSDQSLPVPSASPIYDSIKIISSNYILGNRQKNIPDSFVVQFNKKISVKYILLKSQFCLPEIKYEVVNNGTTVKFYNIICSGLGSEYTFELSVKDNSEVTKIDSVNYKCYRNKIEMGGDIRYYFVTDDNKYCWLTTNNPNQLLQIEIESGQIVKKIPLDFIPRKVVLNPYNNKLYILRASWEYVFPAKIFVMNTETGVIEKTIPILPDQYEHPQYRDVYAYDIEFTKSGYGVLLMGVSQISTLRWKIIDSHLNDSIYIHPEWLKTHSGYGNPKFDEFQSAYVNYDKTKILMLETNGSTRVGELDYLTHNLIEIAPPNAGSYYNNFIVPSKINSSIFFGNLDYQFIFSGNQIWGYKSNFNIGFERSANFTYRIGEEQNIYFLIRPELYIVDYKNGIIQMNTRVAYELHDVTATSDAKYIIFAGNKHLFIFNTAPFYTYK